MSNKTTLEELAISAPDWIARFDATCGSLSLDSIDQWLRFLREQPEGTFAVGDAIAQLGSWLGETLSDGMDAWIGFGDTIPPRVQIGDILYSPFDEISRRLHPALPYPQVTLKELVRTAKAALAQWQKNTAEINQTNQKAWNTLAASERFVVQEPVRLTLEQASMALDPWLSQEGVREREVLCLAAGGGTHAPLLSCAGARVAVVDQNAELLSADQHFATRHGFQIDARQEDMHDLQSFSPESFDIVLQPVSTSYSTNLAAVFSEVMRVLRPGGLYVSQHKSPVALQVVTEAGGFKFATRQGTQLTADSHSVIGLHEAGCMETAHSLTSIIGGICRAGFVVEDFIEPLHADAWASKGTIQDLAQYCPPYLKIKARKTLATI